jgi:hypothetical protein
VEKPSGRVGIGTRTSDAALLRLRFCGSFDVVEVATGGDIDEFVVGVVVETGANSCGSATLLM